MKEPNLNTTKIKILTQQDSRSKIPKTQSRSKNYHYKNLKVDLKIKQNKGAPFISPRSFTWWI